MKTAESKQPISTQALAEFLSNNPTIFQQHPELLELISLTDSRGTASLIERQVALLNKQLREHKSQHFKLVEVARENEQISDNFTDIICQMIGFTNLSEFATEFPKELRNKFEIDEVSFKTSQGVTRKPSDGDGYAETLRRLVNNRSVCDNRWPSSIMNMFFSHNIKSAALIPMRIADVAKPIGVLALGSKDPDRYTNDLGTAHLDRLGLMSGICLARLQPSSV